MHPSIVRQLLPTQRPGHLTVPLRHLEPCRQSEIQHYGEEVQMSHICNSADRAKVTILGRGV